MKIKISVICLVRPLRGGGVYVVVRFLGFACDGLLVILFSAMCSAPLIASPPLLTLGVFCVFLLDCLWH